MLERLRGAVDVVVVHVRQPSDAPAFTDHLHHEMHAWTREFLARHSPGRPDARLELRVGTASRSVVEAAAACEVDAIALGWSGGAGGRTAAVVRAVLEEADLPVLLFPTVSGG
jgi:hypothetical protein